MAKSDVVTTQLQAIQTAQTQALTDGLGACYDAGVASGGGFTQADMDAAVAKAVAAAQAVDQQALADAQAKAASDLAAVQQKLTDMTAKEQAEESVVTGLQQSVAAVQQSLDAIKALVFPTAPAPTPAQPSAPAGNA